MGRHPLLVSIMSRVVRNHRVASQFGAGGFPGAVT
ncbi:hypothetical protein CHELA41_51425 [Hyphomicrobiales bacterium]|nr:hypothetical protein CHELA41_51425 [Hyphomicrobiales bacterium]